VALLFTRPTLKSLVALGVGIGIPLLPFLYFDLRFHWFETRRILDYIYVAQYRIYVPNRWLTYAGDFWPRMWAMILGGKSFVAYILLGLIALMSLVRIRHFKKHWYYYLVAISFVISVIQLRYIRGERFFYYTNYAHAFVILFSAWMTFEISKFNKILGILIAFLVTVFTTNESIKNFTARVITVAEVNQLASEIYQNYPHDKITIYECPINGSLINTAISYKIYYDKRSSLDGIKIGVCNDNDKLVWKEINDSVIDVKVGYRNKSTEYIYKDNTEWWIENPPQKELY
jgi:hypothetical protein